MTRTGGKVHVVRVTKTGYVDKQGRRKDYSSAYLRRTYREAGQVKNETVANISALPDHVIDLIDAGLKGQPLVPGRRGGHHHPVRAARPRRRRRTRWPSSWACPRCWARRAAQRDLALALIISRVVGRGLQAVHLDLAG